MDHDGERAGHAATLPAAAATGVGSLPGTDIDEALALVFDELADFPHLPELPGRGPGADLVGRGASFLVDLHVDRQPSGWRLVDRPGIDARRARDFLARDLDALERVASGYAGPLKVQVAGPWSLAATLERTRGDRPLSDPSACRDISASLAEGVAAHVADIARRVPGATVWVQVDEPVLPGVLAGHVPSVVGYRTVPAVEEPIAVASLRTVTDAIARAGGAAVAHCCAAQPALEAFRSSGFRAVSIDATGLGPTDDDAVGATVEAGAGLLLGLVPSLGPGAPPPVRDVVAPARALWHRLGLDPALLAGAVVVTPSCGLAGASPGWARTALRLARQAARVLQESPEHDPQPAATRGRA